jgi:redox-sensitive bicupin YhaK (pirin superfamily)
MLDLVIESRRRDLGGGLEVGRVLPFASHRMVGPFIFLDHMGPADFSPGEGIDVRPHRISVSRPSRICSTAKSTIATALA